MKSCNFLTELKKEKCLVFVMVSLCAFVSGCKSDKDSNVFTAVTQGFAGSKDYMGGNIVYWSDGDRIRINDCTPTVVVDDEDRNRATVNGGAATPYSGEYYAAYPADISTIAGNGTITFNLPQEEQYVSANGNQIVHSIMAAKAEGQKLNFNNLCAMLHFEVSASGTGVNSKLYAIEVESDEPLWGTMTAVYNSGSPSRWDVTSPTSAEATKRTLRFSEPVILDGTTKDFYLAVPPVSGGEEFILRFILEDGNGAVKVFEKSKNSSYSFGTGNIYNFDNNVFNGSKMVYDGNAVSAFKMGTNEHPHIVYSSSNWNYLMSNGVKDSAGKYIALQNDIEVNSTYSYDFRSILDGNGHTVTLTTDNISMFDTINKGQVRNLTIASANPVTSPDFMNVSGTRYYGSLADRVLNESVIDNCVNTVSITCDADINAVYLGGLCGNAYGSTITNCSNTGTITSNSMYIGGVVGTATNMVAFNGCRNSVPITVTSAAANVRTQYVGGVAGDVATSGADITNCHNTGSISILKPSSANLNCGGVFGRFNRNVISCSNKGNISYDGATTKFKYIGGVAGVDNVSIVTYLINCNNEGNVTATAGLSNIFIGGILGRSYKAGAKNSYAYCTLQGSYLSGIIANGADLYSNVDVVNCYYYGTMTCSTENVFGIAGESYSNKKIIIDKCYYPSGYTICHSSSTDNHTSQTLISAVSLSGGNSTSLRDALNGYSVDWPSGWLRWKNKGSEPDYVVFDN